MNFSIGLCVFHKPSGPHEKNLGIGRKNALPLSHATVQRLYKLLTSLQLTRPPMGGSGVLQFPSETRTPATSAFYKELHIH